MFTKANGNGLWVMILEKAFAKFCGSYAALEGGELGPLPCKWSTTMPKPSFLSFSASGDLGLGLLDVDHGGLLQPVFDSLPGTSEIQEVTTINSWISHSNCVIFIGLLSHKTRWIHYQNQQIWTKILIPYMDIVTFVCVPTLSSPSNLFLAPAV